LLRRWALRGAALLLLLAVLAMGAGWYAVNTVNSMQADYTAAVRSRNAAVLQQAKQALIGYVATQAVKSGENNPGALPCPEAAGYYDSADNQGQAAATCSLPKVGRLPWRTLGIDKLVDAAGEPLWYVVSPGWARDAGNTLINSNSVGQLSLDGIAGTDGDTIVALIIAPGPAITVSAASGCTAWSQSRPATGSPDWRNYLECSNADSPADVAFVSMGPGSAFNDQVVRVTKADVMPALEAAIAQRIEKEIVPQLKSMYAGASWGLSGTMPLYPYPATFANPGLAASYQASNASCSGNVCRGLLPVTFANSSSANPPALCTPAAGSPCDPTFVKWTAGTIEVKSVTVSGSTYMPGNISGMTWSAPVTNCTVANYGSPQSTRLECTAYVPGLSGENTTAVYEIRGTAANVAMAMRRFETSPSISGLTIQASPTPSVTLATTGSAAATFRASGSVPSSNSTVGVSNCGITNPLGGVVCRTASVNVPIEPVFPDHALVNAQHATLGWFMRNEWYRLLYYVVASGHTAASAPAPACTTAGTCLSATNVVPGGSQRALLVLAGRAINGASRPSANLGDYLEFGNARGSFERQTVTAAGPSAAYADMGGANAYVVAANAVAVGVPLQFKVANANTGAATLQTATTGVRALTNADGSALAASSLAANGIAEVTFDGTRFQLTRRPFNDRLIVVDTN
jgi:hypothetical protein